MRRPRLALVLPFLALLLLATPASAASGDHSGWLPVDCACSGARSIDAVSRDLLFLGTSSGINRSTDGGFTWHVMDTPVHTSVDRVSFSDETDGVAAGDFEGVLVTHDGGSTWIQYRPWPGRTTDVKAIGGHFFGLSTTGLYGSTDGVVWKLVHQPFPPNNTPRMDWSSPTDGTVASAPNVFTTTDGGRTFAQAAAVTQSFWDAQSLPGGSGLAVGQRFSADGQPWVYHVTGTTGGPADLARRGVADEQERGVSKSGDVLYVVGVEGLIARSTDNGTTWGYETPPPSYERSSFYDVDSIDADHAWIAVYSGRVLIRNAPALHDIRTAPHRGLGLGVMGLGALAVIGAGAALGAGRRPIGAGLAVTAVALGTFGTLAVTDHRTCPATGCSTLAALPDPLPTETPSATPSPTPSPTPSATPTPTPSATPTGTPTATPTPTPTGTASPTASATPSRTPTRTPSPTPSPTKAGSFTASLTKAPTCDPNGGSHAGQITVTNGTGAAVTWQATAREQNWAALAPDHGTLQPGQKAVFNVTPASSLCQPSGQATTDHVDIKHGTATTAVAVTVTPQP